MILRAFPTGRNVDRVNKWTSHTQRKKSLHVPKLGPLLFLLKWKEGEDGGGGGGGGQKIGEIYIYINIKKRKGRPRWREASNARGERLVKYLRSSSKGKTVKLSSLLAFFPLLFIGIFSSSLSSLCFSDSFDFILKNGSSKSNISSNWALLKRTFDRNIMSLIFEILLVSGSVEIDICQPNQSETTLESSCRQLGILKSLWTEIEL